MQTLLDVLRANGIAITPDFSQAKQRNGSQYLFTHIFQINEKTIHYAIFGDFKSNLQDVWFSDTNLSFAERQTLEIELTQKSNDFDAFKKEQWEAVKEQSKIFIQENCRFIGSTPYTERKKVKLHGAGVYIHPAHNSLVLIVPMQDTEGEVWNYQRIFPEKLSSGDKFFQKAGRIGGLFHPFGFDPTTEIPHEIFIAEGFATAASIYEAINKPVVAAFNSGNLSHVAKALHEKFPSARLIICADNDAWTMRKTKDGEVHYNTGLEAAKYTAKEVGGEIRYPTFKDTSTKPTDFNDLYLLEGFDATRTQLLEAKTISLDTPILEDAPPAKVKQKSYEYLIASSILNSYGDNICKQKKDVFIYNGSHWEHMDQFDAENFFKNMIEGGTKNTLTHKQIGEVWKRLLMLIPSVPKERNMFEPHPYAQNFKNGTLHLHPKPDGSFGLEFKGFNRSDYLLYQHPFAYEEDAPLNEEFEAALDRVWANDPDIETKKKAYFEVLGASLVPAFRKVALFVGPPGSGKSTLILFAVHMVHQSMRCSVDPTDFSGFSLESMAGKLLNYDTDITLTKTLSDSVLKKVEDRIAIRVKRKNQIDVTSVIPGIHLFGANRMPISSDGPEAYKRRMLIFKCSKFEAKGSAYTQDFAVHVWEQNKQGIIKRAIEGLKAVCANRGHFTVPESSSLQMEEWKNAHYDPVEEFLMELRMNEVEFSDKNDQVRAVTEGKIPAKIIWKLFSDWFEKSHPRAKGPGKHLFLRRLKELGIQENRSTLERYYEGFSVEVTPNAMV